MPPGDACARARPSGRPAEGGQGRGRACGGPGARGAHQSAAAAALPASPMPRALRSKTSWPDPTARITSRSRRRHGTAAFAWRSPRDPCWRASSEATWRRADPRRAGTGASRRELDLVRARPDAAGFVCRPDGSAFPVDAVSPDGGLPSELTLALAQARRGGSAPSCIRVDAPVAASSLSRWQRETDIDFQPGTSLALGRGASRRICRRHRSAAAVPARSGSIDVRASPGSLRPRSRWPSPRSSSMSLPPSVNGRRCAMTHGAPSANGSHLPPKPAYRRTLRHRRRRLAPPLRVGMRPCDTRRAFRRRTTRLPLLARATPALAVLPAGAVKSATYADGHWTLDLARPDAATIADLDARLRAAGVPALVALIGHRDARPVRRAVMATVFGSFRLPAPVASWLATKSRAERRMAVAILLLVGMACPVDGNVAAADAGHGGAAGRTPATPPHSPMRAAWPRRSSVLDRSRPGGSCRRARRPRAHARAAEPPGRCYAARVARRPCPRRVRCRRLRSRWSARWKRCSAMPACAPSRRR